MNMGKELSFLGTALRFIGYGSRMGWHERNAGNVSLRLNDSEREEVLSSGSKRGEWRRLRLPVSGMENELVFTTVSGSYFIDMEHNADEKFCVCEINGSGDSYRLLWGSGEPTSELYGHLLGLSELKKRNGNRAVYHCHPPHAVALSFLVSDETELNDLLWKSETECAFVFPEGVGLIPFFIPGSPGLAQATGEKMKKHDAVIWANHGVFASGEDIASAFGLAHAIEKAAEIRMLIISSGMTEKSVITDEQLAATAEYYGKELKI